MVSLVVDGETRDRFLEVQKPIEVRDPLGRLIGVFTPEGESREEFLARYVGAECPYTDEEIKDAVKRPGRPLTEILRDLESR
jgi:hypothetical protein